jgi:rod shape-determining protein MreC
VMSDEAVPAGEMVLTSGGDGIFPKGLLVGRVTKVAPGNELFLNIRVRPAADLSKLEEVLVVTRIDERQAQPDQAGAARAVDILAERLPTVPSKPENAVKADTPAPVAPSNPSSDAKPKAVSPEASASGAPAARKTASSPSSSPGSASGTSLGTSAGTSSGNAATATGTPAMKVSPKPVKAAETPKPQPAVEDSPH